jgi:hypothetical protein
MLAPVFYPYLMIWAILHVHSYHLDMACKNLLPRNKSAGSHENDNADNGEKRDHNFGILEGQDEDSEQQEHQGCHHQASASLG